ncbi:MAG: hypothetical protein GWO22_03235 [Actinobacteria bacterium]|nr:hypothetical protein [Actinomycetota bacterium]
MGPRPKSVTLRDLLLSVLALVVGAAIALQGYAIYELRQDADLLLEAVLYFHGDDPDVSGTPEWEV